MAATVISVINSDYCVPNSIKLNIDMDKGVAYINDEVIFRVKEPSISLRDRRAVCDVSGNPIFTLQKKLITLHGRWEVFKGASTDSGDLVLSAKRSSILVPHKKNIDLDVFLAKNTEEIVWDFKVSAGANKKTADISARGSSTILAKMKNNRGMFEVEVQPNVDYGFIMALLMMVDEIDHLKSGHNNHNTTEVAAEAFGEASALIAIDAAVTTDGDDVTADQP
ncbi:hypothetical protein HN51_005386 [Arachis hypogaea]|uniref:Protein LURP-one-related n=1 Tax=Arachis hypogaea TaxID=3818 RepID=A0A445DEV9_ARAHY|nr:protein LURP-one-related 10-like [Arachis hypogaea]QHO39140.1 Protein LURP-one-related [Arachis hypogaea]RYR61700.1 hypothetical protein Ahy_A04g018899 [Arachis hypogaea]